MAPSAQRLFDAQKRAFREALTLSGVSISWNGVTRGGITSAIARRRRQNLAGNDPDADTSVEMLAEDYDALGPIVENKSVVTIDGLPFVVTMLARDSADPCVHFIASGDR